MQNRSEFELRAPLVNVLTASRRGGNGVVIELDWNGHRFDAAGDLAGADERVSVSVRPSCVEVVEAGSANTAAGEVVEAVTLDGAPRVRIAVGDEIIWAMDASASLSAGAAVGVRFRRDSVAAFPAGA